MTIEGTLPNLIKALDGLSYTPVSNFLGSDSLTVKISNSGDGLSASGSTALTVQASPAASSELASTSMPDTIQSDQSNNWMGVAPAMEALNS
jgi:hypothetical protein